MKKQGKVRAISLTAPKEGMQVIYQGKVHTISSIHPDTDKLVYISPNQKLAWVTYISNLKQLVVEWKEPSAVAGRKGFSFKTAPLKYSQWQAAIDNGEVDSDKEVEFEVVIPMCKSAGCGTPACFKQCTNIAKIIPARLSRFKERYGVKKGKLKLIPVEDDQAIIDCILWMDKEGKPFINTYDGFLELLREGFKPIRPVLVDGVEVLVQSHQFDKAYLYLIGSGVLFEGQELKVKWTKTEGSFPYFGRTETELIPLLEITPEKTYTEEELKEKLKEYHKHCITCIENTITDYPEMNASIDDFHIMSAEDWLKMFSCR